jgi:hypothetical protein
MRPSVNQPEVQTMSDENLKQDIINDDRRWGHLGHESKESEMDYQQQISDRVLNYRGCAVQVYGGWVWSLGFGDEQRWSKRPTRHECERIVYEVVERLGEDEAFA